MWLGFGPRALVAPHVSVSWATRKFGLGVEALASRAPHRLVIGALSSHSHGSDLRTLNFCFAAGLVDVSSWDDAGVRLGKWLTHCGPTITRLVYASRSCRRLLAITIAIASKLRM